MVTRTCTCPACGGHNQFQAPADLTAVSVNCYRCATSFPFSVNAPAAEPAAPPTSDDAAVLRCQELGWDRQPTDLELLHPRHTAFEAGHTIVSRWIDMYDAVQAGRFIR